MQGLNSTEIHMEFWGFVCDPIACVEAYQDFVLGQYFNQPNQCGGVTVTLHFTILYLHCICVSVIKNHPHLPSVFHYLFSLSCF